jgi:hypothetical protein
MVEFHDGRFLLGVDPAKLLKKEKPRLNPWPAPSDHEKTRREAGHGRRTERAGLQSATAACGGLFRQHGRLRRQSAAVEWSGPEELALLGKPCSSV